MARNPNEIGCVTKRLKRSVTQPCSEWFGFRTMVRISSHEWFGFRAMVWILSREWSGFQIMVRISNHGSESEPFQTNHSEQGCMTERSDFEPWFVRNGSDFEPSALFGCQVPKEWFGFRTMVWISRHGSKSIPFVIRTTIDHSKSKPVRISDDHCTVKPFMLT